MAENKTFNLRLNYLVILALIFITLKLTNVITWSWIWVLSPIWGVWALVVFFWLAAFLLAFLVDIFTKGKK